MTARHRNIARRDDAAKSTHGWLVRVVRSGVPTSDMRHGGKRKALAAAVQFRDAVSLAAGAEHHRWRRSVVRRNSESGIPGVSRYEHKETRWSGQRTYAHWVAKWTDEDGIGRQRKFSVGKYGEDMARALANSERERQLERVCAIKETVVPLLTREEQVA